jgi:SAM-dependent methyltransferase
MQNNIYNENFYKSVEVRAIETADRVIKILFESLPAIESVKDIGCGSGIWIKKFHEAKKLKRAIGFDLAEALIPNKKVLRSEIEFFPVDFENVEENIFPKTDLSIFLEVAEHLSEGTAKKIIKFICKTSDLVIFSAAIPGQGGYNHMNEHSMQYWVQLLEANKFIVFDLFRSELNKFKRLPFYYRNNIILAVSEEYYIKNLNKINLIEKYRIGGKTEIKDYRSAIQVLQYKVMSFFSYQFINLIVRLKDYLFLMKKNIEKS